MKRFISVLLSVMMLLSVFSGLTVSVSATEEKVSGNTIETDGDDTELIIPTQNNSQESSNVTDSGNQTDPAESSQITPSDSSSVEIPSGESTSPTNTERPRPSAGTEPTMSTEPSEYPTGNTTPGGPPSSSGKTQIYLEKDSAEVYLTGTVQIDFDVYRPKGETTFTSSDKNVATVNSKGLVKGVSAGKATITVKNGTARKYFTVTVKKPKLNVTKKTMLAGDSFTINITGQVGKAKFESSKKKCVTVSSKGKVKAKSAGSAVIKVKTNGVTMTCKIKVTENLKINRKTLYINKGGKYQLKVSGTKKSISWKSSKKSIVKVSKSGKITAKKAGIATITASTGTKKISCKVYVYAKNKYVENRKNLRKLIKKSGEKNKNGDKVMSAEYKYNGANVVCGVSYTAKNDTLNFISVIQLNNATTAVMMPLYVGQDGSVKTENMMFSDDGLVAYEAYKNISIKGYSTKKNIKYIKKSAVNLNSKDMQLLANSALKISFNCWNKFLKKECKTDMKKIGFVKWK